MPEDIKANRGDSSDSFVTFRPRAAHSGESKIAKRSSISILFVPPFLAGWISGCFAFLFLILSFDASSLSEALLNTAIWTPFAMTLCLGMPQFWLCAGACLIFALNGRLQKKVSGRAAASTLLAVTVAFLSTLDPMVLFVFPPERRISWDFILCMIVVGSATGVSAYAASSLSCLRETMNEPKSAHDPAHQGASDRTDLEP